MHKQFKIIIVIIHTAINDKCLKGLEKLKERQDVIQITLNL